jgi:hypothetical protein
MTADQVQDLSSLVGRKVQTLCQWSGIEVGTIGFVDELYGPLPWDKGQGIMVAWKPESRWGREYWQAYVHEFERRGTRDQRGGNWAASKGITRDGFRGPDELRFLEILGDPPPAALSSK